MKKILILGGANLNLLGKREPHIYGTTNLEDIYTQVQNILLNYKIIGFQSNHEGELIDYIHNTLNSDIQWIIFNPAAFTHTSIALRDALLAVNIPFIEVHLSNVYQRETFRHTSYFSDIAKGVISGFGAYSYSMAAHFIISNSQKI